jgi:hypothetical protein
MDAMSVAEWRPRHQPPALYELSDNRRRPNCSDTLFPSAVVCVQADSLLCCLKSKMDANGAGAVHTAPFLSLIRRFDLGD